MLVARLKDPEDGDSWRRFYQLYRGVIVGVARKAGLREDEAEVALRAGLEGPAIEAGYEATGGRGERATLSSVSFTAGATKVGS
jgi:hypothetical protein